MKKSYKKYLLISLAVLFSLIFVIFYANLHSTNYQSEKNSLQEKYLELNHKTQLKLESTVDDIARNGVANLWSNVKAENEINIHVYHNDSLIFWNSNHLPIIRFKNIQFPSEGLIRLQNGWYVCKLETYKRYTIVTSFLLKKEYSYTNEDLKNAFNSAFNLPFEADISLIEEGEYLIYDETGQFIFSIVPNQNQPIPDNMAIIGMILLIVAHCLWILILFKWLIKTRFSLLIPFVLILFRFASIHFNLFEFFENTIVTDPNIYATNKWFPDFYHLSFNLIYFSFILRYFRFQIKRFENKKRISIIAIILFIGSYFFFYAFQSLISSLIQNSSIHLDIERFFDLTLTSFLVLILIGIFFYSYFTFIKSILRFCRKQNIQGSRLAVLSFLLGFIYILFDSTYGYRIFLAGLFPMVLYATLLYTEFKQGKSYSISFGILLLLLFSIVTSTSIRQINEQKDLEERALYANQLATEKNIATELEYAQISKKIASDGYLKKFIGKSQDVISSVFQENVERRIFPGYWERYEFKFHLFDENHLPIIDKRQLNTNDYDKIVQLIRENGEQSALDENIFYINGNIDQFSYIIKQTIYNKDSLSATLICTLKSKKIPEEIGFPRLLVSSKMNVLESIENYSIAKYHNNRLSTKYGAFHYPSSYDVILPNNFKTSGSFDYGGYNHYALKKHSSSIIILSNKKLTLLETITSFSFLFSLYGLLLLPILLQINVSRKLRTTFTLAFKIQVVLIGLVLISLLSFGWGSGIFVKNQYNEFTNDVIREKLNSVEFEIKAKLGNFDTLSITTNGNYMEYILRKFSNVFFTDINMYDNHGYLLATSRPKVYNVGLLSEQMNPVSYLNMTRYKKSQFIQQENIGDLKYTSAYKPFFNVQGNLMGYINLQHFGQQREFENQIQKFLVAIINVFILLLAISVILAVFISNWLTRPLRVLQENLSQVTFGESNVKIEYNREDEIGSLVKEYNKKLEELENTAEQLAQSEREGAWREMAKQVAHEIKNPLTPMKLRVQQLLRVYDPNDPKSEEKLSSVASSLIEQIDALTKIANEFSTFARMPKPNEETLEITDLIQNVINLFNSEKTVTINYIKSKEDIFVLADKNQLIRVFNNLLKNAIQAIPHEQKGKIIIEVTKLKDQVLIAIGDNGIGMNEDLQAKIFAPNFTTKSTGTGLGLAMVQQIITNHRGTIHFTSKVDFGTKFTIYLPLINSDN